MNESALQERFDKFQAPAVSNIVRDFTAKPAGRFLLVIPTAGGKTFTAVKAVNRLFEEGVLDVRTQWVVWTAHRTELLKQAKDTFDSYCSKYSDRAEFSARVVFVMVSALDKELEEIGDGASLVVIDEAHHAAIKNVSYGPVFARKNLGILGLTATPSRHDGEPLEFERESFSIGFPDLVRLGIVLNPEIRKVQGGRYEITKLEGVEDLEQFNNADRNSKILAELLRHHDEYKKVIIYVGTTKHAENLHAQLNSSALRGKYESISYITDHGNSRNVPRSEFIIKEKEHKRSILVNVTVLSEGYDDPRINTVVMAAPSRSKLYYMQAMGRAIRHDPADTLKRAFCVEVDDTLPNIRYKIDNRWLFSDVSDALEPLVDDNAEYGSAASFDAALLAVYNRYSVPPEHRVSPSYHLDQRYSMLLFKRYLAPNVYVHFPLVITNDNRLKICNMFNFFSERMAGFKKRGVVREAAFQMVVSGMGKLDEVSDAAKRRWIYDAMMCAVPKDRLAVPDDVAEKGHPWIKFVSFHYSQAEFPEELLSFVEDMVNKSSILEVIKARNFEPGSYIIRLPLPLKSSIGEIVTPAELASLDAIVEKIRELRSDMGDSDHREELRNLLGKSILLIEHSYADSLVLVARTDDSYSFKLL